MKSKIFSCKLCGHCCHGESTVSVSRDEIEGMAGFLGLPIDDFIGAYCVKNGKRVEMKIVDGHCIFYNNEGHCSIHPVKPQPCRVWPLHPSILSDKGAWQAIRKDCPGFKKEASHEEVCELIRSKEN